MLEDINNIQNTQANISSKQDGIKNARVSFKGNPNAVDTTPTSDSFQQEQAAPADNPLRSVAYMIPTWYALNKGAELFNRGCGGEYEKSIVGRLGKLGDRLSNSALFKNRFVDSMKRRGASFKTRAQAYIDKHPMLSAMQKTPTAPENSMAKSFMESQAECDIKDASSALNKFVEKTPKTLKEAGATKEEIKALKSKYGKTLFGNIKNEEAAVKEFQLRKIGGDALADKVINNNRRLLDIIKKQEQYIMQMAPDNPNRAHAIERLNKLYNSAVDYQGTKLKQIKLNALGLTQDGLKQIVAEPVANSAALDSALQKGSGFSKVLSRNANKIKSLTAPATKLGRLLPKMSKLAMRGLTFGGGAINTLFVAFPLAASIKNAVDAPSGQKKGTLAEGVVDALSWVISMPLALLGMHSINGIKNTGVSKASYERFRNEKKVFDAAAKNSAFATLDDWKAEKARIKALKAPAVEGTKFTKFMRKIGEFLSVGLEQFTPFKENTKALSGSAKWAARFRNIKRGIPNFLRNCVGYPLRFGLYMFVFAPIVDKVLSLGTRAIFGKAYDPEKAKEEQEKEALRKAGLYSGPKLMPNPYAVAGISTVDLSTLPNNNLIKQKVLGYNPAQVKPAQVNPTQNTIQGFNAAPVTMVKGEPFMPPEFPQQNQQQTGNVCINNQVTNGSDPNKSSVDNVNRTYVPSFDMNAALPYQNPMTDPNQPKNYYVADQMLNKATKTMSDLDGYISHGYKD